MNILELEKILWQNYAKWQRIECSERSAAKKRTSFCGSARSKPNVKAWKSAAAFWRYERRHRFPRTNYQIGRKMFTSRRPNSAAMISALATWSSGMFARPENPNAITA